MPMPDRLSHIRDQIEIIARQEENSFHRRTRSERRGDSLGAFIGSLTFVSIHMCWFGRWLLINTLKLGLPHFDPYAFALLDSLVARRQSLCTALSPCARAEPGGVPTSAITLSCR